ncbi:unnamed protein product [Bursaphelenchus okinawaensis]|uniref:G_PROTEIN_RECEP_F1_2 domain-containing protein n=1 Tax=Bursaphelenchus okinawaensis TaxID=465554 RepID=A0A811K175_9BILA|nr:unnamed protein product [Bursaphelenchus okinawaensis]CAG9088416.1 unnamed protein product [Bursaphelenchus okinawaensis]
MISLFGTALCMNMLAVEQHLATMWVNDYENKSVKVGVILMAVVILQCVPAGIFVQWYCLKEGFDIYKSRDTCVPVDTEWLLALIGFSLCLVTCALCALWLVILHRYNKKKTKKRLQLQSLSARYQQTENENTNKAIKPSLVGYLLLTVIGFILTFFRGMSVQRYGSYNIYDRIFTNLGYMFIDCYAIYHMFCFMYYSEAMRFVIRQDFGHFARDSCSIRDSHVDYREEASKTTETYFSQLRQSWL